MFFGYIHNEQGEPVFSLGPYNFANVLVEDLLEFGPELEPGYVIVLKLVQE